ncbi:MAG: hypothetical protein AYK23_04610 [Candidatus Proteinoplasmatales archaeon SG8-5]|nr:MAG: hypothetical protein AYK23_04610 [Candidatus Proteinoplasmatales archaeon SG8-5]
MSRDRLKISEERLKEVNDFLLSADSEIINDLIMLIEKYGGADEINRRAREAGQLDNVLAKMQDTNSPHIGDIEWLMAQRDTGAFIGIDGFREKVLGEDVSDYDFDMSKAVTLEISACQYFSFLMAEARQAVEKGELMPGRIIRVRAMKEQEEDGDLLAMTAATDIIGASRCETLDNKGTSPGPDGAPVNVHLGGPDTITGYFGGVGQPNEYAMRWADEFLYYYTNYGNKQVLNINPGTVLIGYMMYKLGVDMEFKISVYMGNDNPYAVFWTLMMARLLSRPDGTTPLIGFNFANSVNNTTIEASADIRSAFDLEDNIRFEHHITETWKSIVRQPYNRRDELLELADVANISAKHEGGEIAVEQTRDHPSDILEYFLPRADIDAQDLMPLVTQNYLDKHEAFNVTARELTKKGQTFIAARNLHN